jgi:2-oxoglutarate ferredoxin oxidoreductase subunit delta
VVFKTGAVSNERRLNAIFSPVGDTRMAKGKISINVSHCKGCQLCMSACKKGAIQLSGENDTNEFGFRYAVTVNDDCIACCLCAVMCPDQAIEVYKLEEAKHQA